MNRSLTQTDVNVQPFQSSRWEEKKIFLILDDRRFQEQQVTSMSECVAFRSPSYSAFSPRQANFLAQFLALT